jgi:hypothetical protein
MIFDDMHGREKQQRSMICMGGRSSGRKIVGVASCVPLARGSGGSPSGPQIMSVHEHEKIKRIYYMLKSLHVNLLARSNITSPLLGGESFYNITINYIILLFIK